MTHGAPRNAEVYGRLPSRETAEDLARRSGMTLNEWVARLMAEGPEDATSQDYFNQSSTNYVAQPRDVGAPRYEAVVHPADEIGRVTQAIERLSDRCPPPPRAAAGARHRQRRALGARRDLRIIDLPPSASRCRSPRRFEGEVQEVKAETVRARSATACVAWKKKRSGRAPARRWRRRSKARSAKVAGHNVYEGDKHRPRDARGALRRSGSRLALDKRAGEATAGAIRDLQSELHRARRLRLNLAAAGNDGGVRAGRREGLSAPASKRSAH